MPPLLEHVFIRDFLCDFVDFWAVLKRKVCVQKRAVFELESVDIAKSLVAFDCAVHEAQIFRVPAQIFANDD